jgi:cell division protein FtsW (lipid II flippase)
MRVALRVAHFRPRWLELTFLPFPVLLLAIGLAQIDVARGGAVTAQTELLIVGFACWLAAVHVWIAARQPAADQLVLPLASILCALSLVMMARLVPDLVLRQGLWMAVGAVTLLGTLALLPSVGWLRRYRYSAAGLGLLLVLSTFLFGLDPNGSGARLWLGAGGVYFQPSEILKILLVIFFAAYLDDYGELLTHAELRLGPIRLPPLPYLAPLVFMIALALMTIVLQHDLGAALLIFGVFLALLYVASGRLLYVVLGLGMFMGGGFLLYRLVSIVQLRVQLWLDPWATSSSTGYQIVQALTALAAGGIFGSGLTFGYPLYVPAVHTDFMIAAIGEELGLAGTLAVVAIYALLVHRGLRIAVQTRDTFGSLLAAGLTSVIAIQAFVILAGSIKLMPLTGVTLPLLSYGGSSVLANFVVLALLLAVSGEAGEVERAT